LIYELHTRPKSQELFENIRAKILEGHYPAGQWLKQADLEGQFQAGRSEVRAALSSLAERGIVEYVKNRGFRVFSRSDEDIAEIAEMIVALEKTAAAKIIANASDDDVEKLKELADVFEGSIRNGSQAELRLANYHFHNAVIDLCGNKLIARTVCHLRECCAGGPEARYMAYDGLQKSNREHHAIINAIEKGEEATLKELFIQHSASES